MGQRLSVLRLHHRVAVEHQISQSVWRDIIGSLLTLCLAGCLKCFPTLKWRKMVANLLVLAVVPGHGAVGGLGLDGLAVGAHEH